MMWTSSALHPFCGYAHVLGKGRKRTKAQRVAMDKGTLFHWYVQHGERLPDHLPPDMMRLADQLTPPDFEEIEAWCVLMRDKWAPPVGAHLEMAVGLSPTCRYVEVTETTPHVYAPVGDSTLLTAGRLDVGYPEGSTAVVFDIKTGKTLPPAPDRNLQLWSLGLAYADKLGADSLRVGLYMARRGEFEWYPSATGSVSLDSDEAARRWDDVQRAAQLDETPRPGPHCGTCWERRGCDFSSEGAE